LNTTGRDRARELMVEEIRKSKKFILKASHTITQADAIIWL
jgi:hypothetical protein